MYYASFCTIVSLVQWYFYMLRTVRYPPFGSNSLVVEAVGLEQSLLGIVIEKTSQVYS
jgi:hypothetical protein